MLALKQTIKDISKAKKITQLEMAEVLGISKQNFSNKVQRGQKLDKVILYGSYARGDYNEHSDIDIMILTTLTDEEIKKTEPMLFDLAFDFQMDYGGDISVVVKNKDQFEYWLGALPFYNNVKKEGIVL